MGTLWFWLGPYLVYGVFVLIGWPGSAFGRISHALFILLAACLVLHYYQIEPDPPGTIDGQVGMGQALHKFFALILFFGMMGVAHMFTLIYKTTRPLEPPLDRR